jgi:hypothetical protein
VSLEGPYDKSSRQLVIGYNAWRNTQFDAGYGWVGKLDDVRIYGRALSESEVQDLYNDTKHTVINASQNDRMTDGLVGMWSFNGPDLDGTTATDVSGNGNDGTLQNGPAPAIGKVGQGLEFDGSDDWVDMNSSLIVGANEGTIGGWVYINEWTNRYAGIYHCATGASWSNLRVVLFRYSYNNQILASISDGSSYLGTGGPKTPELNINQWYHIIFTYDGNYARMYLDGEEVDSVATSIVPGAFTPSTTGIGWNAEYSSRFHDGLIDEVRIYDRALSESEIKRLYKMGR